MLNKDSAIFHIMLFEHNQIDMIDSFINKYFFEMRI